MVSPGNTCVVIDLFSQSHCEGLTRVLVKIQHIIQFNNKLANCIKYIDVIENLNVCKIIMHILFIAGNKGTHK